MTKTNFQMVLEFHQKFGAFSGDFKNPALPSDDILELREELIEEEYDEFQEAVMDDDLVGAVDGLVDLLYVTYGALIAMGVDADKVFAEVHESNLSKLGPDGTVVRREDGKILKGSNFRAPDIAKVLKTQSEA